jgi:RimJ/RimL family protein N-acetyltransferase
LPWVTFRPLPPYAFHSLKLHKVYLKATSTNQPAIGMYRKLGFVEEGCLREHEYNRGEYVDEILLGILARESPSPEKKELTCE